MSATLTIRSAQACLRSALADEVTAVGGIAAAAAEVGASEDTLRRWISGSHGDWSAGAIGALVAAGLARNGNSVVLERMQAVADGIQPAGDRRRALSATLDTLPALLAEAQLMAAAAADGAIDREEARRLVRDLPELISSLQGLHGHLLDLLRGAP
jgi:hypothetical protein